MSGNIVNIISRNENEVENFIKLAEEISANVESVYDKRRWLIISSLLILILASFTAFSIWRYFSIIESSVETLFLIKNLLSVLIIASFSIAVRRLYVAHKLIKNISIERYILGDLFNIIDSLKRSLSDDSLMKKAYFDMRTSRINFTHAKFKKQPQNSPPIETKTTQVKPTQSPVSTPT